MTRRVLLFLFLALFIATDLFAGMPAPLPIFTQTTRILKEEPYFRLQSISFFLAGLLFSALIIKVIWNYLQRDFQKFPRLSYGKALLGTVLWGLMFGIVLAMISGARELMTPGAWEPNGITHKLRQKNEKEYHASWLEKRRAALE